MADLTIARRVQLEASTDAFGRTTFLYYCPAGLYPAGSGTREQLRDTWLVSTWIDHASHGQHYRDETTARARFAVLTAKGGS